MTTLWLQKLPFYTEACVFQSDVEVSISDVYFNIRQYQIATVRTKHQIQATSIFEKRYFYLAKILFEINVLCCFWEWEMNQRNLASKIHVLCAVLFLLNMLKRQPLLNIIFQYYIIYTLLVIILAERSAINITFLLSHENKMQILSTIC